jgi:hypothetical protein
MRVPHRPLLRQVVFALVVLQGMGSAAAGAGDGSGAATPDASVGRGSPSPSATLQPSLPVASMGPDVPEGDLAVPVFTDLGALAQGHPEDDIWTLALGPSESRDHWTQWLRRFDGATGQPIGDLALDIPRCRWEWLIPGVDGLWLAATDDAGWTDSDRGSEFDRCYAWLPFDGSDPLVTRAHGHLGIQAAVVFRGALWFSGTSAMAGEEGYRPGTLFRLPPGGDRPIRVMRGVSSVVAAADALWLARDIGVVGQPRGSPPVRAVRAFRYDPVTKRSHKLPITVRSPYPQLMMSNDGDVVAWEGESLPNGVLVLRGRRPSRQRLLVVEASGSKVLLKMQGTPARRDRPWLWSYAVAAGRLWVIKPDSSVWSKPLDRHAALSMAASPCQAPEDGSCARTWLMAAPTNLDDPSRGTGTIQGGLWMLVIRRRDEQDEYRMERLDVNDLVIDRSPDVDPYAVAHS